MNVVTGGGCLMCSAIRSQLKRRSSIPGTDINALEQNYRLRREREREREKERKRKKEREKERKRKRKRERERERESERPSSRLEGPSYEVVFRSRQLHLSIVHSCWNFFPLTLVVNMDLIIQKHILSILLFTKNVVHIEKYTKI
jgi:alpha-galactosidase/6-phospho-beta-glucosidase family protein